MLPTIGLGFKLAHLEDALSCTAPGLWFEVHAENYMVDGGPRHDALHRLRGRFPLSLHCVGLSLASVSGPDPAHVARLQRLVDRFEPFLVSDHLAWQSVGSARHGDFLPFPRTHEALEVMCANIDRVQMALGRPILIENPSLYTDVGGHDFSEADFLAELAGRTGCGLLLDLNNLYVSATNLGLSAAGLLDAMPGGLVGEIHVAGHSPDAHGALLIDTHAAPVADPVWDLLAACQQRWGERPVLIERDGDVPPFAGLMAERNVAAGPMAMRDLVDV